MAMNPVQESTMCLLRIGGQYGLIKDDPTESKVELIGGFWNSKIQALIIGGEIAEKMGLVFEKSICCFKGAALSIEKKQIEKRNLPGQTAPEFGKEEKKSTVTICFNLNDKKELERFVKIVEQNINNGQ